MFALHAGAAASLPAPPSGGVRRRLPLPAAPESPVVPAPPDAPPPPVAGVPPATTAPQHRLRAPRTTGKQAKRGRHDTERPCKRKR